jgi:hypothetical protein
LRRAHFQIIAGEMICQPFHRTVKRETFRPSDWLGRVRSIATLPKSSASDGDRRIIKTRTRRDGPADERATTVVHRGGGGVE